MKYFKFSTLAEAHESIVQHLYWNHEVKETEDGESCWFGEPITMEILEPHYHNIHPASPHRQRCLIYADHLINGTPGDFTYDYHDRLFETPLNQIDYMISKLKSSANTRRAIAVTWRPDIDTKSNEVPCLQYIQCVINNGKLDFFVLFRSEDMVGGFGPNAFGLEAIMQMISNKTKIPMGRYIHTVISPHVYFIRDKTEIANLAGYNYAK